MRKRPEKTDQTKAELREAFWHLYSERPIEKITVGQVCELAGYNRGTFYLHFQDLYELLASIEDMLLAGMTDCVQTCMESLRDDSSKLNRIAACKDVVLYYERNKAYISVLLSEQGDSSFIIKLKNSLKPLWRKYLLDAERSRTDSEVEFLLEYTLAGTLFMISSWLQDTQGVTAFQLAHLVYDFSIKDFKQRASD